MRYPLEDHKPGEVAMVAAFGMDTPPETEIWGEPTKADGPLVIYVCIGCGFKSLFERTMRIHSHNVHVPGVSYRATTYLPQHDHDEGGCTCGCTVDGCAPCGGEVA